jgi:hypothetical protein
MSGRARRTAVILVAAALVLSAGRWMSVFLAERLWESSVSEAVAVAGARRALLSLSWKCWSSFSAPRGSSSIWPSRRAQPCPNRAPLEEPQARLWPDRLPRWTLYVTGAILGVLIGAGAGHWLDDVLLTLDGMRFGVPDPLAGMDLGFYLRDFPLWLETQALAAAPRRYRVGGGAG